jgi:hypothetical protein
MRNYFLSSHYFFRPVLLSYLSLSYQPLVIEYVLTLFKGYGLLINAFASGSQINAKANVHHPQAMAVILELISCPPP